MNKDTARQLGQAVVERRDQLNRSRRQVALMGGPTEPTLLRIERGEAGRISANTLHKLDVGLAWEPGSAQQLITGGEPIPLRRGSTIEVAPSYIVVPAETISGLLAVAREISELAEADSALREASQRLDDCIQPLYSRYITQLLETNRLHGGALGPLVALLGPFLDRPTDPADADWEEARYRRWLAGIRIDMDEATRKRFEARLEAAR
ncbi:helix-turn-helix domain-containing protein [Nocardia shimofusensis]|uniref:helix-turn-helix domain-containing protein n=1 Tax=Nocardia shimofusensis TaxID=228596 RepID=UPI0012EDEB58|nr:helix-turn-helix domain-containing protein [Nocardia shimofusensis]